ncbi:MAG: hypothetical protein HOO96_19095 [Polyangiaceae bacterium]|nr:hypothetical protein [Polyangiaceae bacterium]
MTISWRRAVWAASVGAMLLGCPPATKREKPPSTECSKFGETCEFSPGKLGTCVTREGCTQGNCFICQSQH